VISVRPDDVYADHERSGRITTPYSGAELANLIESANKASAENFRKIPTLVLLKQNAAAAIATTR